MSNYTVTVRQLVEADTETPIIEFGTYPIFDEVYRDTLETKIIQHYYFYEIGFETPAMFNHYLKNTMNEIMPYYNKLYKSELTTFDELKSFKRIIVSSKSNDIDTTNIIDENVIKKADVKTTFDDDSTTGNIDKHSDTPQSLSTDADININKYLSDVNVTSNTHKDDSTTIVDNDETLNTDAKNTSHTNNVESGTNTEEGHEIPIAELILKHRETFLNIDLQVIGELKDLFMQVY